MCTVHLGLDYNVVMDMAVHRRRNFLIYKHNEIEEEKEAIEQAQEKAKGKISGNKAKSFSKSGQNTSQ
jgi:hypothetical protein